MRYVSLCDICGFRVAQGTVLCLIRIRVIAVGRKKVADDRWGDAPFLLGGKSREMEVKTRKPVDKE